MFRLSVGHSRIKNKHKISRPDTVLIEGVNVVVDTPGTLTDEVAFFSLLGIESTTYCSRYLISFSKACSQ